GGGVVGPGVVAPTPPSFLVRAVVLPAGGVAHTRATWASGLVLPIQMSLVGSTCVPACSSGAVGMPLIGTPITVPSLGPWPYSWLVITTPPAAGWFCTITLGLPGMWCTMWRATMRANRS